MAYVAIADRDAPIHDPHTFIEKYIWSQDHKVIAIQYAVVAIFVGLVALVLSGLMRLQLGFPDQFHFVDPSQYYQFVTMHGMIMVIYLLTALFLGEMLTATAMGVFEGEIARATVLALFVLLQRFILPSASSDAVKG